MAEHPAWLATALGHHSAGRFNEAERIYRDVLRIDPVEPDALNLLGLIAAARNRFDMAGGLIGRAVQLRPDRGDFFAGLGNVFLAQGLDAQMVEAYRRALLLSYFSEIPASFAELAAHACSEPARGVFLAPIDLYKSQSLQDVFLDRWVFAGMTGGVFVDIGAHDGVSLSNSFFFEQARGWTGICIEPNPDTFQRLIANRRTDALNCCVAARSGTVQFQKISGYSEMLSGIAVNYRPEHRKRVDDELKQHGGSSELIAIEARTMSDIAAQHGLSEITYLSIDTEGSELEILQSMDLERPFVHAVTAECNFDDAKTQMVSLMYRHGFDCVMTLSHDLVFINRASPYRALHARARQSSV
jgi:FkbM family methyltransferase